MPPPQTHSFPLIPQFRFTGTKLIRIIIYLNKSAMHSKQNVVILICLLYRLDLAGFAGARAKCP